MTPNQNAIESHNRDIKRVVNSELYASMRVVMNSSLPRIIAHFGSTRDRKLHGRVPESIRLYGSAPISIECHLRYVDNRHGNVTDVLFNARAVMIGSKATNPETVDEHRA
ncbi:hypothetical protein PHMEG_0009079 [Phytophthora megakarya]|uniref:Uncharacterized protein n=1 Tax=Phytophthora megakarya TaxID=4795 RepID=A0A225WHZ4_9STRA|nr:hypothetical protein PHMEG_0009079 [Phytophthora megakarya]